MPNETCFVIMAIGDQLFDGVSISAEELHNRYNDLIKEAILKARPNIEITRADEVAISGTITMDIIRRLMDSTFVIADVTYPNPNVFYELGLRHASKPGTFIIRDKKGPSIPFDISHLRRIEYENSPSGLKQLSEKFTYWFKHYEKNPSHADNQFQEIAELLHCKFLDYSLKPDETLEEGAFMSLLQSPEIISLFERQHNGEEIDPSELLRAMAVNPDFSKKMISGLAKAGQLSFK